MPQPCTIDKSIRWLESSSMSIKRQSTGQEAAIMRESEYNCGSSQTNEDGNTVQYCDEENRSAKVKKHLRYLKRFTQCNETGNMIG
ncbi:predicted protein [Sclerotinia sclerotiorum 1980 UF-70]|uniref:Uncharacterized protein n=1 Tax=Sclerotinia sclerotiorum (strain ATCC 18683 / 1980 / Ss-1) TaxID=665079 RepID=A7F9R8_SCLS1|nr:predicted protein [Sclerotinia sclerotiorum 1980 UF-70]EDO00479.1 predicted protein [Sclerotinia sclerotiorum 1980 UF-70]